MRLDVRAQRLCCEEERGRSLVLEVVGGQLGVVDLEEDVGVADGGGGDLHTENKTWQSDSECKINSCIVFFPPCELLIQHRIIFICIAHLPIGLHGSSRISADLEPSFLRNLFFVLRPRI